MASRENLKKIEAILQRGNDNFKKGKPFPEGVVTAGIFDTLHEIMAVDSFVGHLMHRLMDHETCSTCDDLPYTNEQFNDACEEWLKDMLAMTQKQIEEIDEEGKCKDGCVYSKSMDQVYPRLCLKCGKPEKRG